MPETTSGPDPRTVWPRRLGTSSARWWATPAAVACAVSLLALPAAHAEVGPAAADPVRILPYGDSITAGSAGDHTWRYFLDRHLTSVAQPVDLVGPSSSVHTLSQWPWSSTYAEPDFDQDHAGFWGGSLLWPLRTGPVDPGPEVLMTDHAPDVTVVAAGSNDVGFLRVTPERTVELLEAWVARARSIAPTLKVVIVESTITEDDSYARFNALLPALVDVLDRPAAPAALATAAKGFVPSTGPDHVGDTWDAKHPNTAGAQKIAAAVADALASLGVGRKHSRPLPRIPEGPAGDVAVSVTAEGPVAHLGWNVVDGATHVRLERWVVDPLLVGGLWTAQGPDVATEQASTTTVIGMPPCERQRFRVRSRKGWMLSDASHASTPLEWAPSPVEAPVPTFLHVHGKTHVGWRPVPGACTTRVTLTRTGTDGQSVTQTVEVGGSGVEFPTPPSGSQVVVRVEPRGLRAAGPAAHLVVTGPAWSTPTVPPEQEPSPDPSPDPSPEPSSVPYPSSTPTVTPAEQVRPVAKVRGLRIARRGRTSAVLAWRTQRSAVRHQVQVRRAGAKWRTVLTTRHTKVRKATSRKTTRTVRAKAVNLRPDARYSVRVRALSSGSGPTSPGPWSDARTFRTRR